MTTYTRNFTLSCDGTPDCPNPTRNNILIELTTFLQQARPEDTVLVAFAGHGDRDKTNRSYLMAIDSHPKLLEQTCLPLGDVHHALESCPAKQKIFILDACHSGGARGDNSATAFSSGDLPQGKGIIEFLSCGVDEVSWEDDEFQQGVFSYFLARGIQGEADLNLAGNRDGWISSDELYSFVYRSVSDHVENRHRRSQLPVRRGEVSGSIILATRRIDKSERKGQSVSVADQLQDLSQQGRVSDLITTSSNKWLSCDYDGFAPAKRLKLLLSLLER